MIKSQETHQDRNPIRLWNNSSEELESVRENPKLLQFGNSLKQLSCLLSSFYIPIAPDQVNGMPTYDVSGKEKYFLTFRQPIMNTKWRIKYICITKKGYWKVRMGNKKSLLELRSISKRLRVRPLNPMFAASGLYIQIHFQKMH